MKQKEAATRALVGVYLILVITYLLVFTTGCQPPQGPSGAPGKPGVTGPQGPPGQSITGAQGPKGIDGTIITPIQFCPNITPTYPSSFPEFGLCINGQMYGVYSANDGFLALLPNGQYISNGINASCTFTITGCTVNY